MLRSRIMTALLAAALAAGGAGSASAQDATPVTAIPELIATYEAALDAHDAAAVAALYAEDATVTQAVQNGNTFQGREAIEGWVADNLAGIPDLDVTTESVVSEGDRVAWQWVYRGSYTGQFSGLPAGQGQPIELHGASFFVLRDRQIVQETVYFDNAAFLAQTGTVATPASE